MRKEATISCDRDPASERDAESYHIKNMGKKKFVTGQKQSYSSNLRPILSCLLILSFFVVKLIFFLFSYQLDLVGNFLNIKYFNIIILKEIMKSEKKGSLLIFNSLLL